jgi:predicted Rossmann fold flavoprotein
VIAFNKAERIFYLRTLDKTIKIIVLGGGASGYFAAIHCKEKHPEHEVMILEKERKVLKKVKVSGGGRCNVTHACFEPRSLKGYYPRGHKALLGPFHHFHPTDTMQWFESHGVNLKIEKDGRVFPITNSSQTVIDCLVKTAQDLGIVLKIECLLESVSKEKNIFTLALKNSETLSCDRLIVATGSNAQGYQIAQDLGHLLIEPVPSLFTFKIKDANLTELMGLSVPQAFVSIDARLKNLQKGALLITHWGLSGPVVLKLSAWEARYLAEQNYQVAISVNWLGGYSSSDLEKSLKDYKNQYSQKWIVKNSPFLEISSRLWSYLAWKAGVSSQTPWSQLSKKEYSQLIQILSKDSYTVVGKGMFKEEFVTCGGIDLDSVNFKTMQSKHCSGLFFAGEILDVDGLTGGFNFQNAWTTGFLAGSSAGDNCETD